MAKRIVCIYIDDGIDDVGRAVARVASAIIDPHLTQDGEGKQRKSLYHCLFINDDGTPTVVKNFFRVQRNGTEEYISEVLNRKNSHDYLEIKRKADEIMSETLGKEAQNG